MTALLSVRGLTAGYHGSIVLHGVDLDVGAGEEVETIALLGRNGAGKSTLLKVLMGLVRPYGGSVRLNGEEIGGRPADAIARRGVALVPQDRRVFAPLTVGEHLALAERYGRRGEWTRKRALDLFPRLGERLNHRGDQLSGGEQQMLAIARALLINPRLLLLDEPSDGLAPALVTRLGGVLHHLAANGISIVLVEQNLRLARSVSRRVAVMAKGRIAPATSFDGIDHADELRDAIP